MTSPSLSWHRLVVFRVLLGVFFRTRHKSAHDYCCFMLLGSVESLYRLTNGVTRTRAILSKKSFLFLSSSQADLCACCVHIWPMHLLQQCWSCHGTLPLSICELLAVLCTLHTFDPACLLHLYSFVIKFNDFRLSWVAVDYWIMMEWWKEDNWFVLLWDIWYKCEILGKSKNRRVFITLPGRLEPLWNFSFSLFLLHCPNKCQF